MKIFILKLLLKLIGHYFVTNRAGPGSLTYGIRWEGDEYFYLTFYLEKGKWHQYIINKDAALNIAKWITIVNDIEEAKKNKKERKEGIESGNIIPLKQRLKRKIKGKGRKGERKNDN